MDRATDFLGEFEHWHLRSRRAPPPKKLLFASIIGYGRDIGPRKLAQISKQLDENALGNAVNWYFSLDNVRGGNDLILRFADRLALPKVCQPPDAAPHTSSDGQKFGVAVASLNANYSFKRLGKLKVATASQLFRRLNSYFRQHPLYRALKEFGEIPKTLFILKYVDDLAYRQAIERQLNKVEASNKFARAISFGHNREFVQGEKEDQEIAEGCRRLIKNAIICWNYLYLSRVLAAENDPARRAEVIEALRQGSTATWKHFNLHGEFDFSDERMADSIGLNKPRK